MGDVYFFSMSFTPPAVILWCQNNVIKSPIFSDFSLHHPFWGQSWHSKKPSSMQIGNLKFFFKNDVWPRLSLISLYSQPTQAHSRCSINMFNEWMNEWGTLPPKKRMSQIRIKRREHYSLGLFYPSPSSSASPLIFSWFHEWLQSCVSSLVMAWKPLGHGVLSSC